MLDDCRVLLSCLPAQVSGQAFTLDLGTRDLDGDIAITDCWSAPLVGARVLITSRQHGSAPRSRAGMHSCEAQEREHIASGKSSLVRVTWFRTIVPEHQGAYEFTEGDPTREIKNLPGLSSFSWSQRLPPRPSGPTSSGAAVS